MRLSKGEDFICVTAGLIYLFLNKNLNCHNGFFDCKSPYYSYGSPKFNIDNAIQVHNLGVKLEAHTLSLGFMVLLPLLQQICAVVF